MAKLAIGEQDYDVSRPSQATSGCNTDAYIRGFGFIIQSRPGASEAMWSRNGHSYRQTVVLKIIHEEVARVDDR